MYQVQQLLYMVPSAVLVSERVLVQQHGVGMHVYLSFFLVRTAVVCDRRESWHAGLSLLHDGESVRTPGALDVQARGRKERCSADSIQGTYQQQFGTPVPGTPHHHLIRAEVIHRAADFCV